MTISRIRSVSFFNRLQGSSPDPWTDLAGVKPNGQQSTALWICSNDVLRGRSSPIEKTIPSWPRHACEVLCVKGGCVGGSPIGAFKGLWSSRVRYLGAVSGGDPMTGSIKSPRARNPATRPTDCLLDRACFAVLSRELRYESSSSHLCRCSSKLLAPSFSLPALPSSDDTVLQARTPSGRSR